MQLTFRVLNVHDDTCPKVPGQVFLSPGKWDDFSFKTSFNVALVDFAGNLIDLGTTKIGRVGQAKGWTKAELPEEFSVLPEGFFSLGQDVHYYKMVHVDLDSETRNALLVGMRDVVHDESILESALGEKVFIESLTRDVGLTTARNQFRRVLEGRAELTNFDFAYFQAAGEKSAPVKLDFRVVAGAMPSTNVHVLIGRNGVGKTTILNNMIRALMGQVEEIDESARGFLGGEVASNRTQLAPNYFSSVIAVSFSAFDPFLPPEDRADRSKGPAFFYVGMKNIRSGKSGVAQLPPKTSGDLVSDFAASFKSCLSQPAKKERWHRAISRLESDSNFAEMNLVDLLNLENGEATRAAASLASRMSSGHAIVLLTITKLVNTVEEKSLVLLDEPESHLHPPLLSAFTRALAELLHDRNGVAIVATHSPVVLQEVPRSCVWKLTRTRAQGRADRPERETFGENVGVLTREVFGLEVSKSGFHEMLQCAVDTGGSFDSILSHYGGHLGTEARAILITLIAARDAEAEKTR